MCNHQWHLRAGQDCPECLWTQASIGESAKYKEGQRMLPQVLAAAVAAVSDPFHKAAVRGYNAMEGLWKAIKVAKAINQMQGG